MRMPRVALFTDSYHDVDGLAQTAKAIEGSALRCRMPLLSIHAGPETGLVHDRSIARLDLKRWRLTSCRTRQGRPFDIAMWRYLPRVSAMLRWFAPDVLHVTGPSDVGRLGAHLGRRLNIPVVASWHSSVDDHASRLFDWRWLEQSAWRAALQFYKIPNVILAPDENLHGVLSKETGRPTLLMPSGVDTDLFTPARRRYPNWMVNIGYVGRLSAERNVRLLHRIEQELDAEGLDVRFTIVGHGSERPWLERHMRRVEFLGPIRGLELANAYAAMDMLALPSEMDAPGNRILESMSSGVPVVAWERQGRIVPIEHGRTGLLVLDEHGFVDAARSLVRNRAKREALSLAARARALEMCSWDRSFQEVCEAYRLAISLGEQQRNSTVGTPPPFASYQRQSA